jgi:two-component system chemotaxis response regulator CheB
LNTSEPKKLVLLGSSTGGPSHIQKILSALPAHYAPAILIAQHMGNAYLSSFASRLDNDVPMSVVMAGTSQILQGSCAYVCTQKSILSRNEKGIELRVLSPQASHYNPQINALFSSACSLSGKVDILAVILTGIGEDGAQGLLELSQRHARTIVESAKSAIVYGMPMRAAELVNTAEVLSLDEIILAIKDFGA